MTRILQSQLTSSSHVLHLIFLLISSCLAPGKTISLLLPKFKVNFGYFGLTLLSPPCSLSACQNNESRTNPVLGPQRGWPTGRPAQQLHEYSDVHMVQCIRTCIHLRALIRLLGLKRSGRGFCQRALLVVFLHRRRGQGGLFKWGLNP